MKIYVKMASLLSSSLYQPMVATRLMQIYTCVDVSSLCFKHPATQKSVTLM